MNFVCGYISSWVGLTIWVGLTMKYERVHSLILYVFIAFFHYFQTILAGIISKVDSFPAHEKFVKIEENGKTAAKKCKQLEGQVKEIMENVDKQSKEQVCSLFCKINFVNNWYLCIIFKNEVFLHLSQSVRPYETVRSIS